MAVDPESPAESERVVSAILVRRRVVVNRPFALLAVRTQAPPAEWLEPLAREVEEGGRHLLTQVGFDVGGRLRLRKIVELRVGAPVHLASKILFPLTWRATTAPSLFPSLEGDLELFALDSCSTEVALRARYVPPMGRAGVTVDRAALHRIAEATIDDLLARTARYLEGRTAEAGAEGTSGSERRDGKPPPASP